jgi:hypothetical protein
MKLRLLDAMALVAASLSACGGSAVTGGNSDDGGATVDAPVARDSELADDALLGDDVATRLVESGADSAPMDAAAAVFPAVRHGCGLSPTGFVQQQPAPQGPTLEACDGSDQVSITDAQLTLPDGGPVAAGSPAVLTAVLSNPGTVGLPYPCVGVLASRGGVTVGAGAPELFSVTAGGTETLSIPVTFDASFVPGRILFAVWAVWEGSSTDAASIECASKSSTIVDVVVP